jgi:hypothetical protein
VDPDRDGPLMPPRTPDVLLDVERAFADVPRPEHFLTDYRHCCECAEHETTLGAATPATIGLAELGNPGWDPICFISIEGFHYYLPALARLAVGRGADHYLDQFIFHLQCSPERISRLNTDQRAALRGLLEYIFDTRSDAIANEWQQEELINLISVLSE